MKKRSGRETILNMPAGGIDNGVHLSAPQGQGRRRGIGGETGPEFFLFLFLFLFLKNQSSALAFELEKEEEKEEEKE